MPSSVLLIGDGRPALHRSIRGQEVIVLVLHAGEELAVLETAALAIGASLAAGHRPAAAVDAGEPGASRADIGVDDVGQAVPPVAEGPGEVAEHLLMAEVGRVQGLLARVDVLVLLVLLLLEPRGDALLGAVQSIGDGAAVVVAAVVAAGVGVAAALAAAVATRFPGERLAQLERVGRLFRLERDLRGVADVIRRLTRWEDGLVAVAAAEKLQDGHCDEWYRVVMILGSKY